MASLGSLGMKIAVGISTLVCLVYLPWPAGAGERSGTDRPAVNHRTGLFEPPLSELCKAAERGDRAELVRAASRVGPARLAKALRDRQSPNRVIAAALEAAPLLDAGLLLLDSLLPHVLSSDEALRSRAVAAIAALLAEGSRDRLDEWEVASETTRAICQALTRVAESENEAPATRLLAVQGLTDGMCETKPGSLAAAREPDLRRAWVLLLPPASDAALLAAARDGDSRVAAAAGARLCQRQAKSPPLPGQPPLRRLALLEGALPDDAIEILPCLAASADPADKEALDAMGKTGAPAVREAVKRMRQADR